MRGIIECFFGPAWPHATRLAYVKFLKNIDFSFYIYAPKADSRLRRDWQTPWPEEYLSQLSEYARSFQNHGIQFGVGLSPWGLEAGITPEVERHIREKVNQLNSAGVEVLAICFDDMKAFPGMAEVQVKVMEIVRSCTDRKLVFCPTYYSFDPILDRVFGPRPVDYLDQIAAGLSADVDIMWTGNKVISGTILAEDLGKARDLLRHNLFLCDNFFANDGPKNCKYLKLKALSGREKPLFQAEEYWAFNPMNQPEISKISLLSASKFISTNLSPEQAFTESLKELCSPRLAELIGANLSRFTQDGLDRILEIERDKLIRDFSELEEPISQEIARWLSGAYAVGEECLTD